MLTSLREAYARFRLRYPVYFFHHIPKCGGTSVRRALEQWFYINNDYYTEHETVDTSPLDISTYNSGNCVCGHFGHHGYHIYQRYPQIFGGRKAAKRYRVFMFLRDPLKMRCSLSTSRITMATRRLLHPRMYCDLQALEYPSS